MHSVGIVDHIEAATTFGLIDELKTTTLPG